jgi:hypothetical protein
MRWQLTPVALAGTLALAGCASAAVQSTAATPAAAGSTAAGGRANLRAYSINSDGAYFSAIVTGAVGDYGQAVTVDPDGKVDPKHSSELELKLTRGSFRLSIADIDAKVVEATSHEPIYPATCSTFVDVTAAAPVVARSGTGSYRGISGGFTITVTIDEVHLKPCQPVQAKILRQVITLTGPGTLSLG